MNSIPQFLLDMCFHRHVVQDTGDVIYWRDCVQQNGMTPDEVGYLWVFADHEVTHMYRTPDQVFGPSST